MSVLAIGTCRVAHPVGLLIKAGDTRASWFPHSIYTAPQIVQALRTFGSRQNPYHCWCSGEALSRTINIPDYSARHWDRERPFLSPAKHFEAYIIEVSSVFECFAETPEGRFEVDYKYHGHRKRLADQIDAAIADGRLPLLNNDQVVKRDMTESEFSRVLQRVTRMVGGKPILWVISFDYSENDTRNQNARKLADRVARIATMTRTDFYDSSRMIDALGKEQTVHVGKDGKFGSHFTQGGIEEQSKVFQSWLDGRNHNWITRNSSHSHLSETPGERIEHFDVVCDEQILETYAPV